MLYLNVSGCRISEVEVYLFFFDLAAKNYVSRAEHQITSLYSAY